MMPSDALKLAEEALETSKCYLRIYSDERLHKDTWEGSEDQATLDTDKEECEKALTAIRAARAEWGWRLLAELGTAITGLVTVGRWLNGKWVTKEFNCYADIIVGLGYTHYAIPQLPQPPAREEVGKDA